MGEDEVNIRLATLQPDVDSRDLFAALMKRAERGEIIGAVVVPIYRRERSDQQFSVHLAGIAATNPTFAVGVNSSVGILLRELALKKAGLR
jgi:hypothetical protein